LTQIQPGIDTAGQAQSFGWPEYWPESAGEFEYLVDCLMTPLVRFAFRRLQSLPDAEDVVQDVFARAFDLRGKQRGKKGVVPYLFKMTANACTDCHRRTRMIRGKHSQAGAFQIIEGTGRHEQEVLAELERIDRILAGLPRHQAEIIRMRVVDELSFAQISHALNVKLPTVKSRFLYGIGKLRKKISALEGVE